MLALEKVSLRRGPKLLIEDCSFQVHAGQRLGVIGANGSGKSSLFAMLLGQLEADGGELRLNPHDEIAHVAQESPSSDCSALDYVIDGDHELRQLQSAIAGEQPTSASGDGSRLHALYERMDAIDGYSAEARASRLLHGLGFLGESVHQSVTSFSGGWRMRLSLAQALMCRSDILLLDEPTNHLDLPAILWLERWLKRYQGILLVISHDRDFMDEVCTRVAHLEHQRIQLFTGNYSQFEAQRSEQLAQQQALYVRQQKEVAHIQHYVDRFRYKASKARQAQSRLKMLERMTKIAPAHIDSPFHFHFLEPRKQPQHLLKLTDCSLGYPENQGDSEGAGDGQAVLEEVDLSITAGDRLGLLGVNGAGKSTLVKALASGSTLLAGERVLSKDTEIGYFAQHQLELLVPEHSPVDHLRRIAAHDRETDLRHYLGRFGFSGDRIFEPVAPFSGGEKARLVLALTIRQRPNLLLLDEPTNHLDLEMRQALSVALIEYSGALVVISHDRHLLRSVCDELLIVHDGKVNRFDRSLDEYPAWLKQQQLNPSDDSPTQIASAAKHSNRKQLRQQEAERRRALKPLYSEVSNVEKQLAAKRLELEALVQQLCDETFYSDPKRQSELTAMTKQQATLRAAIDALEEQWLEASEALEAAQ